MSVRAVVVLLLMASPSAAQVVSPGLEQANPEMNAAARAEVQRRVEDFLQKLGRRDVAGVRAMLAPKVLIAIVRQQRDRSFSNVYETGDEFMARFEKDAGLPRFEEPLTNVIVTIDSERLAYVRADFTVVRDGKVVSSGVDQFTLLKEPDGWKLAMLAYTSLPAAPR